LSILLLIFLSNWKIGYFVNVHRALDFWGCSTIGWDWTILLSLCSHGDVFKEQKKTEQIRHGTWKLYISVHLSCNIAPLLSHKGSGRVKKKKEVQLHIFSHHSISTRFYFIVVASILTLLSIKRYNSYMIFKGLWYKVEFNLLY
jgi:hypothetical protein